MIKQILALVALSLGLIFAMMYAQNALNALVTAHDWVSNVLKEVFSGGPAGNVSRQLIALICLPLLVGLVPALLYYVARRSWFPYFMHLVWVTWLVQTAALVVLYKAGT